jgi:hypothetical protein
MGKTFAGIDDDLRAFIGAQRTFFVATAPLDPTGHAVCAQGLDTLRILEPRHVAYLDYVGSGAETTRKVGRALRISRGEECDEY